MGGEVFNSDTSMSEPTVDVRGTINAVAAAMAPATTLEPSSASGFITTGQNLPDVPGPLQLDGSSSSKVLIRVK